MCVCIHEPGPMDGNNNFQMNFRTENYFFAGDNAIKILTLLLLFLRSRFGIIESTVKYP